MDWEQIKKLRLKVVSEPNFALLLHIAERMEARVYLVGGLIRDAFLGRETGDADFVLSRGSLEAAARFAEQTGGTLVPLRESGGMARVVLKSGTFDFAEMRGPDLLADLTERDFTINAVALPLDEAFRGGFWTPVDPLRGIEDLLSRTLRMVSRRSFAQDPLRLLRAFRLCAQGDLTLEPRTLKAIEEDKDLLLRAAPERLHQEWLSLLAQEITALPLRRMAETGLMTVLFPEMVALKGLVQNGHHHLDVFDHSLLTCRLLEVFLNGSATLPEDLCRELAALLDNNKKKSWLKWAALFHDLGKAICRSEKGKDLVVFHGHAQASGEAFLSAAERLRVGNQERDYLLNLIRNHMRPFHLAQEESRGNLTRRALIRLLRDTRKEVSALFLLALADDQAAQGPTKPPDRRRYLLSAWRKAIAFREEVYRSVEQNPPLLNGQDLIALGLKPGPLFGRLLSELREERLEGRIQTREEALRWLTRRLQNLSLIADPTPSDSGAL